jgi:hypothetical protein
MSTIGEIPALRLHTAENVALHHGVVGAAPWKVLHGVSTQRRKRLTGCASCAALFAKGVDAHSHRRQELSFNSEGIIMGRGILLWMLGVPLPVILLLAMCSHH